MTQITRHRSTQSSGFAPAVVLSSLRNAQRGVVVRNALVLVLIVLVLIITSGGAG